jgi:HTH-type transcriptional regulator / antitoxin HipB
LKIKNIDHASNEKNITGFDVHLNKRYGKRGTAKRTEFEIQAKAFLIGEVVKNERRIAKLTQEQLADKIDAKKSLISRIENGKSGIQLSTMCRLLEFGFGKKVELFVH